MINLRKITGKYFKPYAVRHTVRVGIAVLLACLLQFTISFSHEGWIVIAAFLVSQTTRGTPLRQGLIYLVITVLGMTLGSVIAATNNQIIVDTVTLTIFVISGMIVFIKRPLANNPLYSYLLFVLVYFIALMMPAVSLMDYQFRLFDTAIGAVIAIVTSGIVLPVKLGAEFADGVLPAFNAFDDYFKTLINVAVGSENKKKLSQKILAIENVLQRQSGAYPEWVYEVGFNRGLRAGFRFFLLSIERIADNLMSLNFLLSRLQDDTLLDSISTELSNVMVHNQQLLAFIVDYFETQKLPLHTADFTTDVASLEQSVQRMLPAHIEFLDMSPNYIVLTAIMRDIRDLRQLLLSLVMALPSEAAVTGKS
jgi:hypothetical protein